MQHWQLIVGFKLKDHTIEQYFPDKKKFQSIINGKFDKDLIKRLHMALANWAKENLLAFGAA